MCFEFFFSIKQVFSILRSFIFAEIDMERACIYVVRLCNIINGEYNGSAYIGRILVQIASFLQFFGSQVAFVPPFLSESADEWLFQKLIHGKLQFLT